MCASSLDILSLDVLAQSLRLDSEFTSRESFSWTMKQAWSESSSLDYLPLSFEVCSSKGIKVFRTVNMESQLETLER